MQSKQLRLSFRVLILVLLSSVAALAQTKVTSPLEQFGHNIGDDYFLVNYTQMVDYWKKLAQQSNRMRLVEVGHTAEGRTMYMAIITAPENHKKLDHYKDIARRLALAESLTDDQARALAVEGKAVVWIDGGLHATEVLGAQQLIETVYQMVSMNDAGQLVFDALGRQHLATWAAVTAFTSGTRIYPTVANGFRFTANNNGTSGAVEPVWPTSPGRTVVDGTITWTGSVQGCDENDHGLVRFTTGPGNELLVGQGSSVGGSTVIGFGSDNDSQVVGNCSGCKYQNFDGFVSSSGTSRSSGGCACRVLRCRACISASSTKTRGSPSHPASLARSRRAAEPSARKSGA